MYRRQTFSTNTSRHTRQGRQIIRQPIDSVHQKVATLLTSGHWSRIPSLSSIIEGPGDLVKGSTAGDNQRKDKAMTETVSRDSTIQDDQRAVPTVPEDVTSPDGSRIHPEGLLTSSTAHNRTDNPLRPVGTGGSQDQHTNKNMAAQNETAMAASGSMRERRGSTATTATMMSNATSLAGKSVECPGCKKIIDQASGGVVVAFG